MGQYLYVDPIILTVELLEDGQESRYEVGAIDRELCLIILPHEAAHCRLVPQVLLQHC